MVAQNTPDPSFKDPALNEKRVSFRHTGCRNHSIENRLNPQLNTDPADKPSRTLTDRFILLTAEGFGLGRIPVAPGTWGSLWGLPLGWALGAAETTWWMRLLVMGLMFVVGVPLCDRAATLLAKKDPGSVVWDEMAAFPLIYAFVPLDESQLWLVLLCGFGLFRIFDIWKPPPVRNCDRLTGGFGIMLDDIAAGAYAAAALWLLFGMP